MNKLNLDGKFGTDNLNVQNATNEFLATMSAAPAAKLENVNTGPQIQP